MKAEAIALGATFLWMHDGSTAEKKNMYRVNPVNSRHDSISPVAPVFRRNQSW
jgi:hypothetical protein